MSETKKTPDYVEMLDNGQMKVKTREGDFIMEEPTGEIYDNVERVTKNTPSITDFTKTIMLVSKSLIQPKLGEEDLKKKYKLSTLLRLVNGFKLWVDEDESFLSTTDVSSK